MYEFPHASLKQCSKCTTSYPATPEFFSRDRSKKDGFHTTCKVCEKASKKAFLELHPELLRERSKKNRELHKEHISAHKKQWQQGESYKAYQRRYQQEHKQEIAEQKQRYYQERREETCNRQRQYLQTERGRMVDRAHRQKRRVQAAESSCSAQQLQEQLKRQKSKCYYCHVKLGKTWHADHVVPLSRGGSNSIDNIVIACAACNQSKHARLPHEWPDGGRLL